MSLVVVSIGSLLFLSVPIDFPILWFVFIVCSCEIMHRPTSCSLHLFILLPSQFFFGFIDITVYMHISQLNCAIFSECYIPFIAVYRFIMMLIF